jgi:DNA-binding Xre family transcriptional regulator
MSAFGVLLGVMIEKRGFTERSLAKAIGISKSAVNGIKVGERTPPIEKLGDLCDTLGLHGSERSRFLALAHIAHLPDAVQDRWEKWWDEHERLKAQYADLEKLVNERLGGPPKSD